MEVKEEQIEKFIQEFGFETIESFNHENSLKLLDKIQSVFPDLSILTMKNYFKCHKNLQLFELIKKKEILINIMNEKSYMNATKILKIITEYFDKRIKVEEQNVHENLLLEESFNLLNFDFLNLNMQEIEYENCFIQVNSGGVEFEKEIGLSNILLEIEKQKFSIMDQKTSIGKKENNKICLDHATVSSSHLELLNFRNDYYIKDLGSTNGTFIRLKKNKRLILKQNMIIRVGEIDIEVKEIINENFINLKIFDKKVVIQHNEIPLIIGRKSPNDQIKYLLNSAGVSSNHCLIVFDTALNSYLVQDNSRNGTFLRLSMKKSQSKYFKLENNDEIFIGALQCFVYKVLFNNPKVINCEEVQRLQSQLEFKENQLKSSIQEKEREKKEIENKLNEEIGKGICTICFTNLIKGVLDPCGHCLCSDCANQIIVCPFCKKKVKKVLDLYL